MSDLAIAGNKAVKAFRPVDGLNKNNKQPVLIVNNGMDFFAGPVNGYRFSE
jgi:hypothetical protein